VKRIFLAITIMATFILVSCGFFGAPEEVRQQPGRAIYRAPGEIVASNESPTPAPQKVPGESR